MPPSKDAATTNDVPPSVAEAASVPLSIAVRLASTEDADAVAELVHSAYRSEESRRGWTTEADLIGGQRTDAEMVRELVDGPTSIVLVGRRDSADDADGADDADRADGAAGTAAGTATGQLLACCLLEHRGDAAYLGMFAVRPGLQGQGVGRMMLRAAEEVAGAHWGVRTVQLTVLDRRPELIAWYERCGFTLTGERHTFPYGDERFGVPHHDDLALLGMAKELAEVPGRTQLSLSAGELAAATGVVVPSADDVRPVDLGAVTQPEQTTAT